MGGICAHLFLLLMEHEYLCHIMCFSVYTLNLIHILTSITCTPSIPIINFLSTTSFSLNPSLPPSLCYIMCFSVYTPNLIHILTSITCTPSIPIINFLSTTPLLSRSLPPTLPPSLLPLTPLPAPQSPVSSGHGVRLLPESLATSQPVQQNKLLCRSVSNHECVHDLLTVHWAPSVGDECMLVTLLCGGIPHKFPCYLARTCIVLKQLESVWQCVGLCGNIATNH